MPDLSLALAGAAWQSACRKRPVGRFLPGSGNRNFGLARCQLLFGAAATSTVTLNLATKRAIVTGAEAPISVGEAPNVGG